MTHCDHSQDRFECSNECNVRSDQIQLFPASHSAICDWNRFPWHRDRYGVIQTHNRELSQALAIDVFGTIKVSDERDRILGALARECAVPDAGPWTLKLEWTDPHNLLCEPRPTQIDAIASGRAALLVIECKFTEVGGNCSQPNAIRTGAHRGMRQCNGDYALQTNPVNEKTERCALTGKGVRYWEGIPKIFGLDADKEYRPCPFRGEAYQWMRNVILADKLASSRAVSRAVIATYADAEGLATARKVRSGTLGQAAASGRRLVVPLSYQSIVTLAQSQSENPTKWNALAVWVERKTRNVTAQGNNENFSEFPF